MSVIPFAELPVLWNIGLKYNDMTLLVNANTKDYKDRNILDISSAAYPKLGVIHMK